MQVMKIDCDVQERGDGTFILGAGKGEGTLSAEVLVRRGR